jgi:hypothetical protein
MEAGGFQPDFRPPLGKDDNGGILKDLDATSAHGPMQKDGDLIEAVPYPYISLGNQHIIGFGEAGFRELTTRERKEEQCQGSESADAGKIPQKDTSNPRVGRKGNMEIPVRTGGFFSYSKK